MTDGDAEAAVREVERLIENVVHSLRSGEYDDALAAANDIGGQLDCALCEDMEKGVVGGVLFAVSLSPDGRADRAELIADSLEEFLGREVAEAKERTATVTAGREYRPESDGESGCMEMAEEMAERRGE